MNIYLRLERPEDYRESEEVMKEAFWNHYTPGCDEHYLLHIMRDSPNFVPELDYVAISEGKIVGIVVFLKSFILADDGSKKEVLSMGPIAVLPQYQRMGIGRKLITHTCDLATQMGYRAILLCGEPNYYSKVGFVAAEQFGIRTAENKFFEALHVYPLYSNALNGISGRYYEDTIYDIDPDKSVEFDRSFPQKERITGTPTQKRFAEAFAMQKDYEIIQKHFIDSCTHPSYKDFQELYDTSFPIFEQRTHEQQMEAFQNKAYKLLAFTEGNVFLGFISYWQFDTYCYIEHFAINARLRGKGYGSKLLDCFVRSMNKIVLLEIDPITDNISEARLRFYQRCRFHENPHPHKHPVYRNGYCPHPLIVLTTQREISPKEYRQFDADLRNIVMNFKH